MPNFIKKLLLVSVLFSPLLFAGFNSNFKKPKFLQPEEAFQISAVKNGDLIETKVTLADKIHVYDDDTMHYRITSPTAVELDVQRPASHDFDGDKVFEKEILLNIPVTEIESKVTGDYTLEIEIVGCSDMGICYQPFKKSFIFKGKEASILDKIASLTKEGNTAKIADVLGSESSFFIILLFFIF